MLVTCFSLCGVDVWIAGCCVAAPAEYATPPTTDVIATAATLVRTMRRDGRRQERNAMVTSSENGNACASKLTPLRAGRRRGNARFRGILRFLDLLQVPVARDRQRSAFGRRRIVEGAAVGPAAPFVEATRP